MKKGLILSGAIGLLALGLASCSSDSPDQPGQGQVAEKNEVRYMRINIANPPSSRASFEDGTAEENAVTSAYFKFYDINGIPVGDSQEVELEFQANTPANSSVGQIASAVVSVTIPKDSQMPAYVVAFLNPVDFGKINEKSKMEDLRNQTREDYKSNDGSFAMTNSVYYGPDAVSGASMVKILGTPIVADALYPTKAEAEAEENTATVDIYVERYAAKVNFTLANNSVTEQTVGAYTLTFVPEVWSVNADAANMYASKRFEDSNADTDVIPTYTAVQTMLGNWTTWNDTPNHRSYWACSPSYYATQFPTVSDDIIAAAAAAEDNLGTGAGVVVAPYDLRYYSYNQIAGNSVPESDGKGVTAMNNAGNNWKYVMENTMGLAAFQSLNPKAAAPSLVLVGGYTVTKEGTELPVGTGFCTYRGNLYWRDAVPAADAGGQTILNAMLAANQILSTNQTTPNLNLSTASDAVKNCFEVVHPAADVRGTQAVPHRYVTLQLKSDLTAAQLTGLYFKPQGSDAWVAVTVDNITNINNQLWGQLGNARAYSQGKGYFSIPIQHLGYTENTTNPPLTDGVLDWAKVRVGDFGLVRNHVYSISVTSITGMADGIENLDNPLVPAMDENDYWIKYSVNILNWRVVPTQPVNL